MRGVELWTFCYDYEQSLYVFIFLFLLDSSTFCFLESFNQ